MPNPQFPQRLLHIQIGFLLAFLLVWLAFTSWATWWSPALAAREDNPRLVEAELRLQRGRILDANETVLAHSVPLPSGRFSREYPAGVGEPIIGYYSLRHGTAGIESSLDEVLRGAEATTTWRQVWGQFIHEPQHGRDVRLTLRAEWQAVADELLAGRQGAIILLSLNDNAVRVMASQPTYDPNLLNEQFNDLVAAENAPLLNRATQGLYQPGLILAPFIMAGAAQDGLLNLNRPAPAAAFLPVTTSEGTQFACPAEGENLPEGATWGDLLRARCPAALVALTQAGLDEERLAAYWAQFGLTQAPSFALAVNDPEAVIIQDLTRAVLGQEGLTVTPLQMALAWAVLGREGVYAPARLVSAVAAPETGAWQGVGSAEGEVVTVLAPAVAEGIRGALPQFGRLVEYEAVVLSGPEGRNTAWYMALAPAVSPRFALVVVLEDEADTAVGRTIGREMLGHVLE